MGFTQGQDQAIFQCSGLQFEIEMTAKTFAQRQSPGPHDAGTQWRVHNEVHIAGVVKKSLKDNPVTGRYTAQRLPGTGEVAHQLGGGSLFNSGFQQVILSCLNA